LGLIDTAWRAGEQAWQDGLPVELLYVVAGQRAKAYAHGATPRTWVRQVFEYTAGFRNGYLSAGLDEADAVLKLELCRAEWNWRTMKGSAWYAVWAP
jgi:hypothetical protein